MNNHNYWLLKIQIDLSKEKICDLAFEGFIYNTQEVITKYKNNTLKRNNNLIYEFISPNRKKLIFLNKFLSSKRIYSVIRKIEDKNWIQISNKLKPSISIGNFKITSSKSITTNFSKSKIPIALYFNNGFGTGQHPTTKGCLLAIEKISKIKKYYNTLEIGSGSGILSIAIKKIFNTKIIATEEDKQAYQASINNFRINNLSNQIKIFNQCSIRNSIILQNSPYELIVANILARPIIKFSPFLNNIAKKNTTLVLSGFNSDHFFMIINAYRGLGFILIDYFNLEDWITLILEKRKNYG